MASFCEECGNSFAADERFCTNCGTPCPAKPAQVTDNAAPTSQAETASRKCPACQNIVPPDDVYCNECGAHVSTVASIKNNGTNFSSDEVQTQATSNFAPEDPNDQNPACAACDSPIPKGNQFCIECGASVTKTQADSKLEEVALENPVSVQETESESDVITGNSAIFGENHSVATPPPPQIEQILSTQEQIQTPSENIAGQCPECHQAFSINDAFCNECGARVRGISHDATKEQGNSSRQMQAETHASDNKPVDPPLPEDSPASGNNNSESTEKPLNSQQGQSSTDQQREHKHYCDQETKSAPIQKIQKHAVAFGALAVLALGGGYWLWHKNQAPIAIEQAQAPESNASNFRQVESNQEVNPSPAPSHIQPSTSSTGFIDTPFSELEFDQKELAYFRKTNCNGVSMTKYTIRKAVEARAEAFYTNSFRLNTKTCDKSAFWSSIAYIERHFKLNKQQATELYADIVANKIHAPASAIDIEHAVKKLENHCPDLLDKNQVRSILFDDNYLRTFMMYNYIKSTPRIDKCVNQVADEGGRQVTRILGAKSKGRANDREFYVKLSDEKLFVKIINSGGASAYLDRIKSGSTAAIQ